MIQVEKSRSEKKGPMGANEGRHRLADNDAMRRLKLRRKKRARKGDMVSIHR